MIAYLLIILGFCMRLVPHVPNMAPIAAIALFAGAYLDRRITPWVPLVIMVVTDLIIGMHDVVLYTWGAFIVIGFMGMSLKQKTTPGRILGLTVLSALFFFVVTNFGVWIVWYPRTFAGFLDCYVKALPFLRNTMASNVVFSFVLFGSYELAKKLVGESKYRTVLLTN
jgi:hypothetical protein